MKNKMARRRYLILPGCSGASALVSRSTLALRAPANQQSMDEGEFSSPCKEVSTRGITVFINGLLELHMGGGTSDPVMGSYRPRVRLGLGVGSRQGLAVGWIYEPRPISNQSLFPSCGTVSTEIITVVLPGLLELQTQGRNDVPGLGHYPPWVRRHLDVGSRGNFRSALAP